MTTAVEKLLELEASIKVVQGGTWAGKTAGILPIGADYGIRKPKSRMTVVAETVPAVKAGALHDFKEIMQALNRWDQNRYNATDRIYTFGNGTEIQFTAFENAEKAKQAGKRNWLFLNEANTIPFDIADALMTRTDDEIWIDYNPTSSFWCDREIIGQPDVDFIKLTYRDNEALPDKILASLLAKREKAKTSDYWKNWCAVYLDGEMGRLEGACIPDWKELDRLPTDKEGELECKLLCYGVDFGYSNDPSTLVALYKWNNAYIFDESIYQTGLKMNELAGLMKTQGVTQQDIVYIDSSAPLVRDELKLRALNVLSCGATGKTSIVYGINLINQNEIYVTKRSKNLINELHNYIWIKDRDGNKVNKPIDAFNHAIDAARYALTSQLENPHAGEYHIW